MNEVFLFGGPSLYDQAGLRVAIPPKIVVLPPASRGSISELLRFSPASKIVLIDGVFHHDLAVGHAELRRALQSGWRIWGLASMGAVRAYEMRMLGMHGYGEVYGRFLWENDFQDDEVALLHTQGPPYRPISEPLVHLRNALHIWRQRSWIKARHADEIAAHFKSLWYGERHIRRFQECVLSAALSVHHAALLDDLRNFDHFRTKLHDVRSFLLSGQCET